MRGNRLKAGLVCMLAVAAGCVGPVREHVVSVPEPQRKVLIATRNTPFKNALVDELLADLAGEPWSIKVADITDLVVESADDYDVIVMVDRLWGGKISSIGSDFVNGLADKGKLVLVVTAHSPDWRPEAQDIDAVTAPSTVSSAAAVAADVAARIRAHAGGA
jgi:hypothetical protein